MMAALQLLTFRQEKLKVTLPSGGVFAGTKAPNLGGVENTLDTASDSRRRLGLGGPDRA